MKRIIYTLLLLGIGISMTFAQMTGERVYVQTDKDFYLSGEKMYLSVYGLDREAHPLDLSKVVYVELLGDAFNTVQVKVEMSEGKGNAVVELPYMLSSGVYELVAYTRWMRNEGEKVFFRKPIGIYNSLRYTPTMDKVEFEDRETAAVTLSEGNVPVRTDKSVYGNREKVVLSFSGLPTDAHFSVSVTRQDVGLADIDKKNYDERERSFATKETERLLPELEGLIIEARYTGEDTDRAISQPNLSIKGKEFHYYSGQSVGNGKFRFFTPILSGMKEMVAGMEADGCLEMISPFVATPSKEMQALHLGKMQEKALLERSMQIQVSRFYPSDSIWRKEVPGVYMQKPQWSYDLDEYRRFKTFEETFLEFIPWVSTKAQSGKKFITVFDEVTGMPNNGNTLVMLDGVTIMNHEDLLKYNPYFVKWIDVYIGKYVFGNQMYEGIVSFRTPNCWMPNFQLPENCVVVEYEGTLPQEEYAKPDFRNKSVPDLRHTLYWNPTVTSQDTKLECWTSDLDGTYVVKLEGFTKDGKKICGFTSFEVRRRN